MIDWDAIYAMVSSAIGVTWEYLDQCMTLPRLYAYFRHWEESPPVHVTLAAFIKGLSGNRGNVGKNAEGGEQDLNRIIADFGAAGFEMKGTRMGTGSVGQMISDLVNAGCKPRDMK